MKTIFVTGGHLTPALAVIETLQSRGWRVLYVGRKHALEGDRAQAQEYRIIGAKGIPFLPLTTGRFGRQLSFLSVVSWFKVPVGFVQMLFYLFQYRPDAVLSFGGYVAVPAVLVAAFMHIPVVIHEQTFVSGFANRFLSRFAQKICIAWEESEQFFPKTKIVMTGNPIRKQLLSVNQKLTIDTRKPLIYITGGNLGSHTLNLVVEKALPQLLKKYSIIHQTGNTQEFADFARLQKLRDSFSAEFKSRYIALEYIDEAYIGWVFKHAAAMVSRAGANTVTEAIAFSKPTLFVPLPWSGGGEQETNANFLAGAEAALVLPQNKLTPKSLSEGLENLFQKRQQYIQNLKKLAGRLKRDAPSRICDVVESVT